MEETFIVAETRAGRKRKELVVVICRSQSITCWEKRLDIAVHGDCVPDLPSLVAIWLPMQTIETGGFLELG